MTANTIYSDEPEKTVLLVDDNEAFQQVTKDQLSKFNFNILVAGNGQQAWKMMQSANQKVDIVLLDLVMPGTDGVWFLETLRNDQTYKNTPIVIFTNLSHGEKVGRAIVKGISRLLVKENTSVKELAQNLREALHESEIQA
jgi:CheY-like chemotaxis protein